VVSTFTMKNNQLCPPYPECLTGGQEFTDENENGIWDEGEPFFDCGLDGICPEDNDYISPDEDDTEGNGIIDNVVGEQDTSNCPE
jgi:hypothetical protein